jgi:hypothetical protein
VMAMSACVAFHAPEVMSDETRNLYLIALHPKYQRAGIGSELVKNVEDALIQQGGRILLVETSRLPKFEATNLFYRKCGFYQEERSQSSAVLGRIWFCHGNWQSRPQFCWGDAFRYVYSALLDEAKQRRVTTMHGWGGSRKNNGLQDDRKRNKMSSKESRTGFRPYGIEHA